VWVRIRACMHACVHVSKVAVRTVLVLMFDWFTKMVLFIVDSEASRQEEISARTGYPAPSNPYERQCAEECRENVTH